ncbi:hypothetical protein K8354_06615 [Polaribacter litorisediminis]|uniref:hypothetical protein n=1 Tax=Polaribacter litorisediminis TaxID=1908341 RepID=UPI001CC02000|nr:hypothetical protein [Polaribacter litorisediminis]UAM99475.1 hypothetical protein K8354_06615 [Polaribacter litorisediminis]
MLKKKYNKKLIKNIFTVMFGLVLLFWLFQIDWNNLSSRTNSGLFFGVLAGALFIISMQLKNKDE